MMSIVEEFERQLQGWESASIADMVFEPLIQPLIDLGSPALGHPTEMKLDGSELATTSTSLPVPANATMAAIPSIVVHDEGSWSMNSTGPGPSMGEEQPGQSACPMSPMPTRIESDSQCDLCDYRPKGDPKWFRGSMAKHKKLQHSATTTMYECPYPGCTSKYKNRPDNLRQHQLEKNHFMDEQEKDGQRPPKRRRS